MQAPSVPIAKDIVLVGGGHSHAIVLRLWGMRPVPGVRLTLISEASDTPYSGMLPGYVAGVYSRDACYIDLRSLCNFAGAQFYVDRVVGLDLQAQQVLCAHRPPVRYDFLSIDIGSTPHLPCPPEMAADARSIPAKPIRHLLEGWQRVRDRVAQSPERPLALAVVGGGVGGVELTLAVQHALSRILQESGQPQTHLAIALIHRGRELLPSHNLWVRDRVRQVLQGRGVALHLGETVLNARTGAGGLMLACASGLELPCEFALWVTQATAAPWIAASGLAVDDAGFLAVDGTLRSLSHANVFAAGDVATMVATPRPKAGVFAVRQGKPLYENLCRAVRGEALRSFVPQTRFLSLIGTSDGSAIASWGRWGWQSPLLWQWKDRIDRAFMAKFSDLPLHSTMTPPQGRVLTPSKPISTDRQPIMYCAGCASKVGSTILTQTLQRLRAEGYATGDRPDIPLGLDAPDDAAAIRIASDRLLVQTVDWLPSFLNDPYLFGQIATHHALGDLYAMGAQPHSALAIATLPHATAPCLAETLYQLLAGALTVLQAAGATLSGGHTTEGNVLALGLTCNGTVAPERLLRKGGMHPGEVLVLTQAIGTGTLFAAAMGGRAKARWIDGAIAAMSQSNREAAACLARYGATACTDVTGFGLAGHLLEMARASGVSVRVDLGAVPLLEGATATAAAGWLSSLHPQNTGAMPFVSREQRDRPEVLLLFDPQTAGGLLASLPRERVADCLTALRAAGYLHSAAIGDVIERDRDGIARLQIQPLF